MERQALEDERPQAEKEFPWRTMAFQLIASHHASHVYEANLDPAALVQLSSHNCVRYR